MPATALKALDFSSRDTTHTPRISAEVTNLADYRGTRASQREDEQTLLERMVKDSGVEAALASAGCRFYELEFFFKNEPGGKIECFLNPLEHRLYNCGWFSLADVQAWAWGFGPVVRTRDA